MDIVQDDILAKYDLRNLVVGKKRRNKSYWVNWDSWNILYKTLAYETSSSRDVENYFFVRNIVVELYTDVVTHVGCNYTFDIMNGWWFCFKTIFGIETSRHSAETKAFIEKLKKEIESINKEKDLIIFIHVNYGGQDDLIKSFLEFLEVVYTIGNISPINVNPHADLFDSWEYKLFESDCVRFSGNSYIKDLGFNEYKRENQWTKAFKEKDRFHVIKEYMDSRITLIKNRGEYLIQKKDTIKMRTED